MISRDSMLGAAAALVDAGCAVFPVRGKIGRTPHGSLDATRDYAELDEWWPSWLDAGIGIATGRPSGWWALDNDGEQGAGSLRRLEQDHGPLPQTVAVRTFRGEHLYWKMPADRDVRNSAGEIASGLDVRGTGGHVVAPPSRHPSGGRYRWLRSIHDVEMVAAPDWLLARATRRAPAPFVVPHAPVSSPVYRSKYIETAIIRECELVALAPEGTRNDQLNRSAHALGRLVAAGSARAENVERTLRIAAQHARLGDAEIRATISSAWRSRGCA